MSVFSRRGSKRVKRIADNEIKRLVGLPEVKFFDFSSTAGLIAYNTAPSRFGVAQGITNQLRLGNSIKLHSILFRFYIINDIVNTAPINFRFIFGIDWENQAAGPNNSDILQNATTPSLVITSPLNLSSTRGRFKILLDKTIVLEAGGNAAGVDAMVGAMKFRRFYKRLSHHMEYSGVNAGDTGIGTPFILTVSDRNGAAGVDNPALSIYTRIKFTDV